MGQSGSLDFVVTRTAADYREALVQSFWRGRGPAYSGMLGVVAAGCVFFPGIGRQSPTVLIDAFSVGVVTAVGILVVGFGGALFTAARVAALPGALQPLACSFSDHAIQFTLPSGASTTAWDVWKGVLETRNLFILTSKMGSVHVLPKRDLSADQAMRLRILLNDKLGDRTTVFVEHRA